jgi:TP901 family phage tail tape measure protein
MAKGTVDVNINVNYQGKNAGGAGAGGDGAKGGGGGGNNLSETKSLFDIQRQLTKEYRASASATGEISEQTKKLKAQLEEVNGKVRKFNEYGRENKNTWGNALNSYQFKFNALGNIIANVTSSAANMLKQLGSSVVTISKDFEFAMSGVKAITQATDKEFNQLISDSIRLGGATLYTARQIAGLQEELAKLGFTVPEIRAATDGVVALASATGEDLSQSALVAGTMIRQFGLNASDLTSVVDVMTESFNRSALDLYKFQETMKYVGPVASVTGYKIKEVTAMMARLADQGVVGSQAGTSLRNLLLRLADANSELAKAMGGPVDSLPKLIIGLEKLNKAGLDATKALSLADRYSVTALLAMAQSTDGMWKMYEALNSVAGSAQDMSEIRMDNFAGSIEKLSGEWDSLTLSINKSNGVLRYFVDLMSNMLNSVTELFKTREQKESESIRKIAEANDFYLRNKIDKINEERLIEEVAIKKSTDSQEEKYKKLDEIEKKYDTQITQTKKDFLLQQQEDAIVEQMNLEDNIAKKQKVYDKARLDSAKDWEIKTWKARLSAVDESLLDYERKLLELESKAAGTFVDPSVDPDEAERRTAEQRRIEKERKEARIDSLADGLAKEMDIIELDYAEKIANAKKYGFDVKNIYQNREDELLRLIEEYNEKQKKLYEERNKQSEIKYIFKGDISKAKTGEELAIAGLIQDKFERDKKAGKLWLERSTMNITPDVGVTPPNIWDEIMGVSELTSEQKQTLEKGINFITDAIDELADKEAEMADRRVENSERVVNQLQQDIENEMRLAELGYANNLTLRKKQLEDAKRQQAEALRAQEAALKRQRQLETASQTIDLLSATAGILKNSFKSTDPISASIIAGAALLGMWGTWAWSLSKASEATKYGEGGEVVGAKHSQGGVPIEAEGGEFVVKASAYSKYADLVNAINEDKINSVYGAMNRDLTVSLDDRKYDRMMCKYFGTTRTTYHNGYRIEQSGNRTRTIRYA